MAQEQQKLPVIAYVVIFVLVLLVILPRDEAIDCGLRPSVERGFFIAALEERVYFNLSLTSYRGLSILVKNEKGLSQSCQIPEDGSPFVVVMKQKSHSYQWELSHDGKTLFHGKVIGGLEPFHALNARGWLKELLETFSTPPIWIGERLLSLNTSGMVVCYELARQVPNDGEGVLSESSLRLSWLFVPPRLASTWSRRRHKMGGLAALPNGFVSFFFQIDKDTVGVCALDVEERARRWPENALPKERHLLPKWVLDKKNEWNCPTKGEYFTHYSGLPLVTPVGLAHYEQGRLFVQMAKGRRAGFLCYDPEMMRINWNCYFEREDLERVPLHTLMGGWLTKEPCGGAKDFTFVGSPRSVGGRIYGLVDTGTYGGISYRQLALVSCRPCVIRRHSSAPSIGKAIDGHSCFRLAVDSHYRTLNTPIELNRSGGSFRFRRDDYLYEWSGASSLPKVKRLKKGSGKRSKFIDLVLVGQYEVGRTEELLQVAHPQSAQMGKLELPFPGKQKTMTVGPQSIVALTTRRGLVYTVPLALVLADSKAE